MELSKRDQAIRVLRNIQLEALDELDRICRKHDIKYMLAGGSCLGAVRHRGYIPWDDDIDVDMDRTEFYRLLEVCREELDHDRYEIQCMETDPDYHNYSPRFVVKNTVFNNKSTESKGMVNNICIDIFINDFVPNDPEMRQEFLDKIYMIKVLTYFKLYGQSQFLTHDEKEKYRSYVQEKSFEYFHSEYDKYVKYYHDRGEKTDYYISSSVINGNLPAFPYSFKDRYIDVKFEDRTYRTIADYDRYLSMLYGKDYMAIFPPEKRVSHHRLKRVEFGPYAEKFGYDMKDIKYLLMNIDTERALQVKKVSLMMLDVIDEICRKHSITYYLAGNDVFYKANGTEEYASLWRDDMTVFMMPEDLEKFIQVSASELDSRFYLECRENSEDYFLPYAKLKLNNTIFRDRRTFPADVNNGLWINIGLLINTSRFRRRREKHYSELSSIYEKIRLKWLYDERRASNVWAEDAEKFAKWQEAQKHSLEELLETQKRLIDKYRGKKTGYVIDASTSLLKIIHVPSETFGKGTRMTYLGHEYMFPDDIKELRKLNDELHPMMLKHLRKIRKIRNKNPEKYELISQNLSEKQVEKINKKVNLFDLGMYDAPNYRAGVFDIEIKAADPPEV